MMWPLIWSVIVAAVLFFPRLLSEIPYRILMLIDSYHRAAVRRFHERWPYPTVSHTKPIRDPLPAAERAKWHLYCHEGRQLWLHDDDPRRANTTTNQRNNEQQRGHNFVEEYSLNPPRHDTTPPSPRTDVEAALKDGAAFLCKLQDDTGSSHWPNDYSGPNFLTCGPVFAKYIMHGGDVEKTWTAPERRELTRYLVNIQNDDGGFGMHTSGVSTMFGTVLSYVVLRLLGEAGPRHKTVVAARSWIRDNGGAQYVPTWAAVWLCTLGLYSWEGVNAVPAEMWLLPDWLPVSMGRVWCHSRIVTLAFGWLFSTRFRCAETPLLREIRDEIYQAVPYAMVDWPSCRDNARGPDLYTPTSPIYNLINRVLLLYEKIGPIPALRRRALDLSYEHMKYDDETTNYICLGPVNKALNMLVTWIIEESRFSNNRAQQSDQQAGNVPFMSDRVNKHLERLPDYFWMGHDGMRMSGYNGSQLWDTSFALQAMLAAPRDLGLTGSSSSSSSSSSQSQSSATAAVAKCIARGHGYVDVAQVRENPSADYRKWYRSRTAGAWNFSTRAQGWQVSDCTAEGLRVDLLMRDHPDYSTGQHGVRPLEEQRLFDAVDCLLAWRNKDAVSADERGWASYEEPRAPVYLELLNCAEVYKDIMVDYTYCECTSSVVHSLVLFQRLFPQYRGVAIRQAIADGVRCVKAKQRADGSWYGSWGVCFTYAAWLSTEALRLAGEPSDSVTFRRAREFLLSKQHNGGGDGGFGEDFNSCVRQVWVDCESQVVQTAWAVMALISAAPGECQRGDAYHGAVERAVRFIMARQLKSGDWHEDPGCVGVFNGSTAIEYHSYKNCMPVWALAKYVEWVRQL